MRRSLLVTGALVGALMSLLGASRMARAQEAPARVSAGPGVALATEKVRLENGLTVLLAPDNHAPLVSVEVSYAAGAADDPEGKRGLAHLVEHLVATGTRDVEHPAAELELAGACRMNARTNNDRTAYFETLPPSRLETALWVESDRMAYAASAVTEARVDTERAAVKNELRDRTRDASLGVVGTFLSRELFPEWHPYELPLDDAADLGSIHASDVLAFLHTWYSPGNATLAIAGAFEREPTLAAVHRYFDSIPSREPPKRAALPAWSPSPVKLVIDASVAYDSVAESWLGPAFGTPDDAALDLAAAVLAERLAHSLVAGGMAVSAGARESSMRRASVFSVEVTLAGKGSVARAATAIQRSVDELARPVSAEDLDRAREVWCRHILAVLETPWARAGRMIVEGDAGQAVGAAFDWGLGRYNVLTADDVARAVSTWLARSRRVTTFVLSRREAPQRGVLQQRLADDP